MASPYYDHQIRRVAVTVAAGQTDAEVKSAESGRKLRVLSAYAIATAATALTFNRKGSGSGVAISAPFTSANGVPTVDWDHQEHGWCETEEGESLTVTTGAGQSHQIQLVLAALESASGSDLAMMEDRQILWLENSTPLLLESA